MKNTVSQPLNAQFRCNSIEYSEYGYESVNLVSMPIPENYGEWGDEGSLKLIVTNDKFRGKFVPGGNYTVTVVGGDNDQG